MGAGFDTGDKGVVGDEAGDVVNVTVGIVSCGSAVQPDGLVDAEVVVEGLLNVPSSIGFIAETRVTFLNLGEQALLSS